MSPSPYDSGPGDPRAPIPPPVENVAPSPYASAPNPYAPSSPAPLTGDGTGGVIPFKNPKALTSYYIGLFSLIPCLGLFMAPAALVLGIQGLQYAKLHPIVKGQVHAWVGIVCGGFWTLVHLGLVLITILVLVASIAR